MAVNDMEPNMRPFTLKTGLFLTLILVFLLVNIGVADAQSRRTCPALTKRIEFSVKTISRNIDYDLSVTQPQLRRLANRSASSRVSPNERALGLTSSRHMAQKIVWLSAMTIIEKFIRALLIYWCPGSASVNWSMRISSDQKYRAIKLRK
jgi:hypothetical protein